MSIYACVLLLQVIYEDIYIYTIINVSIFTKGMRRNCDARPVRGAIGFFSVALTTPMSVLQPIAILAIHTSIIIDTVKAVSMHGSVALKSTSLNTEIASVTNELFIIPENTLSNISLRISGHFLGL
jgi:hypothetical protein